MKSKNWLLFVFCSLLALTVNAQTIKTYKGALNAPNNIPLADGTFTDAVYNYYDGENMRVWHGTFALNRLWKSYNKSGHFSINGKFSNGKATGTWTWEYSGAFEEYTIKANYKNDKLNGAFLFTFNDFVAKGHALNGNIVDTLYIKYRGKKTVTGTRPVKYVYYTNAIGRLIFDKDGYANNSWEFVSQQGIKKHYIYYFLHGLLIEQQVYDESTGERNTLYSLSEQSLNKICSMVKINGLKVSRKENASKYNSDDILNRNVGNVSFPFTIYRDYFFALQAPFASFDMNIESIALQSKTIEEAAKTAVVCNTIEKKLRSLSEPYRHAFNVSSERLDSLYMKKSKKQKRKSIGGGGLIGIASMIASSAGQGKIDNAIAHERQTAASNYKKLKAYEDAALGMKTISSRKTLVEYLNTCGFSDVANIDSLYGNLPQYEAMQVSAVHENGNEYTFDFISNYNTINLTYNVNSDSITKLNGVYDAPNIDVAYDSTDNSIYETVDEMPSFTGGSSAMFSFLSKNVKYPVVAEENGVQGRVLVSVVVERDGSISNIKIVKSVDTLLDKEALRVVRSMPKWIPGKQGGKLVRVKYSVPVTFRIQ